MPGSRRANGNLGSLGAEVRRRIFFLRADLGLGFHTKVVIEGVAVSGIGSEPERAGKRLAVVAERKLHAVHGGAAVVAVRVIELGVAEADLDIGDAKVVAGVLDNATKLGPEVDNGGVADRVAEEVRRKELVGGWLVGAGTAQRSEGAMQLGGHDVQQNRGLCR